jgi:hypothetical protein
LLPPSYPTSPPSRYSASERGDLTGKYAKALDVWRFRQGMIAELQAFVIQSEVKDETGGAV